MCTLKLKWRVDPKPTGRYASFQTRGWPSADVNGAAAAMLTSSESYQPRYGREDSPRDFVGDPLTIGVRVADWTNWNLGPKKDAAKAAFSWRTLKLRYSNIADAKAAAQRVLEQHPEFLKVL
jgi:hypothetical protein